MHDEVLKRHLFRWNLASKVPTFQRDPVSETAQNQAGRGIGILRGKLFDPGAQRLRESREIRWPRGSKAREAIEDPFEFFDVRWIFHHVSRRIDQLADRGNGNDRLLRSQNGCGHGIRLFLCRSGFHRGDVQPLWKALPQRNGHRWSIVHQQRAQRFLLWVAVSVDQLKGAFLDFHQSASQSFAGGKQDIPTLVRRAFGSLLQQTERGHRHAFVGSGGQCLKVSHDRLDPDGPGLA